MRRFGVIIAAAIILGATFFAGRLGRLTSVHAQNACDASSLSGAYGYTLSGFAYDAQFNSYILASVGRLVADGAGNFTGADSFNFDGSPVQRKYTGTYTIKDDCTGSLILQTQSGTNTITNHFDFVTMNGGREVNLVQMDTNFIFSGVMKRQNP